MNKKTKGITLIALVITIIVLLILAGVTIATLSGDNGILTRAAEAKEKTRREDIQEQLNLWKTEKSMEDNIGPNNMNITEFVTKLKENKTITPEEFNEIETTHKLTIGKQEPIIFPYDRTLVDAFEAEELHVGDWVNYTAPQTGEVTISSDESGATEDWDGNDISAAGQTFNVDKTTTWRVLGVEGEGPSRHINLIADRPVENNKQLYLKGAKGYLNSKTILDKISNIYLNTKYADSARSVKIEDINQAVGAVKTEDDKEIIVKSAEGNQIYQENKTEYTYNNQFLTPQDFLIRKKNRNFHQKYRKLVLLFI